MTDDTEISTGGNICKTFIIIFFQRVWCVLNFASNKELLADFSSWDPKCMDIFLVSRQADLKCMDIFPVSWQADPKWMDIFAESRQPDAMALVAGMVFLKVCLGRLRKHEIVQKIGVAWQKFIETSHERHDHKISVTIKILRKPHMKGLFRKSVLHNKSYGNFKLKSCPEN